MFRSVASVLRILYQCIDFAIIQPEKTRTYAPSPNPDQRF